MQLELFPLNGFEASYLKLMDACEKVFLLPTFHEPLFLHLIPLYFYISFYSLLFQGIFGGENKRL